VQNAPLDHRHLRATDRLSPRALDLAALLATALGHQVADTARLAVAVSGGPDSLALLWLAATTFPGRVAALTVDHGLRAAASAEAGGVATLCAGLDVPHKTLSWTGDKPQTNLQAAARAARYALMGAWCVANGTAMLLTAHHADDQAETLVMRLQRGSGSSGLAGIRAARPLMPGVTLVRPLLSVRRAELVALVAAVGWTAVDDPSNNNLRYDRTAARAWLARNEMFDVPRLAATATHLAAAETALDWAAARAWAGNASVDGDRIMLDVAGLPDELVRRLVLRAILHFEPEKVPHGPAVADLQHRLAAGGAGTLAGVKARGGEIWRFNRAAPRRKST
jgi:tRNA(Ile)-lysidine synthase